MKESMLESAKRTHSCHTTKGRQKMDDPRNFRPNEREKKSQGRRTEKRRSRQTREKRCNEPKEHWINTQGEEIKACTRVNSKTVHQKIKEIKGEKREQKQDAYDQKMETF